MTQGYQHGKSISLGFCYLLSSSSSVRFAHLASLSVPHTGVGGYGLAVLACALQRSTMGELLAFFCRPLRCGEPVQWGLSAQHSRAKGCCVATFPTLQCSAGTVLRFEKEPVSHPPCLIIAFCPLN